MGTWSQPHTTEKAQQLARLMASPLPQKEAFEKLYHLCGDDDLFDFLEELEVDDDVRSLVKSHITQTLKNLHLSRLNWDAKAIAICQQLTSKQV